MKTLRVISYLDYHIKTWEPGVDNEVYHNGIFAAIYKSGSDASVGVVFKPTEELAITAAMKTIDNRIVSERMILWEEIVRIEGLPPWTFCPSVPDRV